MAADEKNCGKNETSGNWKVQKEDGCPFRIDLVRRRLKVHGGCRKTFYLRSGACLGQTSDIGLRILLATSSTFSHFCLSAAAKRERKENEARNRKKL